MGKIGMKAEEIANGIQNIVKADKQTSKFFHKILKDTEDELRKSWVVNQFDCAKYLSDDEFETLQGLIKKVDLLREKGRKK